MPRQQSARPPRRPRALGAALLAASCLLAAGCPRAAEEPVETTALPFAGQALKLLVVGDPPIADAVRRLSGEWNARTGATVEVVECAPGELLAAPALAADAVVYPEAHLPELALRDWLAEIPEDVLNSDLLGWTDVLPALRNRVAMAGGRRLGVPLGSPVLVCWYRADLFERFAKRPPETWREYQQLAEFFADAQRLGDAAPPADRPWLAALEPLAPGWAGLTLLARAAPYAKHPYYSSTWFQGDTLDPRIDLPPVARALEELSAAARLGRSPVPRLPPDEVRAAFWRGECAMAVSWPTAAGDAWDDTAAAGGADDAPLAPDGLRVGFCRLPGAVEVFDPGGSQWDARQGSDPRHVPLLSIAGRVGSVARGSPRQQAAFQLLAALAGREWGQRLGAVSPASTLFRTSHVADAAAWVDPRAAGAAAGYAEAVESSLSSDETAFAPRLAARDEYLAALDEAVVAVLDGGASPQEALSAAAARWRAITDAQGPDRQRALLELDRGQ